MEIPPDYWSGRNTLELEYPWWTPDAIRLLDKLITKEFYALEFGSGGSTMFFSRRAKELLSFETNPNWFQKVRDQLDGKQLFNVESHLVKSFDECRPIIVDHARHLFDVVLVDCEPGEMMRKEPLEFSAQYVRDDGLLILDNYDTDWAGDHEKFLKGWVFQDYNDEHWFGKGTRVYRKPC
jgi:predicted O-methyltransferase YrrM